MANYDKSFMYGNTQSSNAPGGGPSSQYNNNGN